jgi:hypothetical protein
MIGKGIRKRLGHDDSPAKHSLVTSDLAPEQTKGKMIGAKKFPVFIFLPLIFLPLPFPWLWLRLAASRLSFLASLR